MAAPRGVGRRVVGPHRVADDVDVRRRSVTSSGSDGRGARRSPYALLVVPDVGRHARPVTARPPGRRRASDVPMLTRSWSELRYRGRRDRSPGRRRRRRPRRPPRARRARRHRQRPGPRRGAVAARTSPTTPSERVRVGGCWPPRPTRCGCSAGRPGQSVGLHDHGDANGAFVVVDGELTETAVVGRRGSSTTSLTAPGEFGRVPVRARCTTSPTARAATPRASTPTRARCSAMGFYRADGTLDRVEAVHEQSTLLEAAAVAGTIGGDRPHRRPARRARARLDRVEPDDLGAAVAAGDLVVDIRPEVEPARRGRAAGCRSSSTATCSSGASTRRAGSSIPAAHDGRRVVLVCNEGYASSLAAATLQDLGLAGATDLAGGYRAWFADARRRRRIRTPTGRRAALACVGSAPCRVILRRHRRCRPHPDRSPQRRPVERPPRRAARHRPAGRSSSARASTRAPIGQVVGGCVSQVGEQSFNVTRTAWLAAGLPMSDAGHDRRHAVRLEPAGHQPRLVARRRRRRRRRPGVRRRGR